MKNLLRLLLIFPSLICFSGCTQDTPEQNTPTITAAIIRTSIPESAQVTETLPPTQTLIPTKTPTLTITPTATLVASYYDELPPGEYLLLGKWGEDNIGYEDGVFTFDTKTGEIWKFSDYFIIPDSSNGKYSYQKTEKEFYIWDMFNNTIVVEGLNCFFITVDNNLEYGVGFCILDGADKPETVIIDFSKNEFICLDENLDGDPYFFPPQISPNGKYIIARKMCYWDCKGIGDYYIDVDCRISGKKFEECSKKLFMPFTNYYSDYHIIDWSPDNKYVAGIIGDTNIVKIFDPHNNYAVFQFAHRKDLVDVFWSQCNEGLYLIEMWPNNVVYYDLNTKTFVDINLENGYFMRGVFCKE